jgi:hypothetical protein
MTTCTHTASLAFRKATASGGNQSGPNCVEVAAFQKAASSNPSGNCVEVATTAAVQPTVAGDDTHAHCTPETCLTPGIEPGDVVVRDSKLGDDSPLIVFSPQQWVGVVMATCAGAEERHGGDYLMRDPRNPGVVLRFTAGEWNAFRDGCTKGEFNY